MYIAMLVVLFAGIGAYSVAEKRGRSGALWLLSTMGVVAGSYTLASQAAETLAGSNAIFDSATGTAAMAVVLAGPLAGVGAALLMIWGLFRRPPVLRAGRPVQMWGEGREWSVRVEDHVLILASTEQPERRVAVSEVTRAEVDGECLALEFRGADPLTLRPHGHEFGERDLRVTAVEGIVAQLR